MTIALFITCLTETFYPRSGIAVVKVLEHLGHRLVFPQAQTCCGQPMFNNGHHNDARDLARRFIRVFDEFETIVTPSASCASMIREYYPSLFGADSEARAGAEALAKKTYEFVEYLTRVQNIDLRSLGVKWSGSVTYHSSCHLRGLGMRDEPEQLISQIEGIDLRPLARREQCCGFGGSFAVNYPEISVSMVRDKVADIQASGAETLVCNEAGCTMNIAGACRRQGLDIRTKSLAEIIAEGLGLFDSETES